MYICQSESMSVFIYVRHKSTWWNARTNAAEHTTTCHSWTENDLLASRTMSGKLIWFNNKLEHHLGFAAEIVTVCEKLIPRPPQKSFINLKQPPEFLWLHKQFGGTEKKTIEAFDQDQLRTNAIKCAFKKKCTLCVSIILSHMGFSFFSATVCSDNNYLTYLQVQKQYEATRGCWCCQSYQLCRVGCPVRWQVDVHKRVRSVLATKDNQLDRLCPLFSILSAPYQSLLLTLPVETTPVVPSNGGFA